MTKRFLLLAGCLLALSIGVAACGDDDGDGTTAATTDNEQAMQESASGNAMKGSENIVALASSTPDLSTLAEAVTAAGLVQTLEGPGPFTVFAPTNQAFDALGNQLNTLLEPANKAQLADILTYHVVPGDVQAADLSDGQKLETVQGDKLTVKISNGKVMINDATVTMPDVEASNGVVHVINKVLVPPGN